MLCAESPEVVVGLAAAEAEADADSDIVSAKLVRVYAPRNVAQSFRLRVLLPGAQEIVLGLYEVSTYPE